MNGVQDGRTLAIRQLGECVARLHMRLQRVQSTYPLVPANDRLRKRRTNKTLVTLDVHRIIDMENLVDDLDQDNLHDVPDPTNALIQGVWNGGRLHAIQELTMFGHRDMIPALPIEAEEDEDAPTLKRTYTDLMASVWPAIRRMQGDKDPGDDEILEQEYKRRRMLSPPPPILPRRLKPNPEPSQGTLDYVAAHLPEDSTSQDPTFKPKSKASGSAKLNALRKSNRAATRAGAAPSQAGPSGAVASRPAVSRAVASRAGASSRAESSRAGPSQARGNAAPGNAASGEGEASDLSDLTDLSISD